MLSKTKKKTLYRPMYRAKYHANFDNLCSAKNRITCLMNRAGIREKILHIWHPVCVFKGAKKRSNNSAIYTILVVVYVKNAQTTVKGLEGN